MFITVPLTSSLIMAKSNDDNDTVQRNVRGLFLLFCGGTAPLCAAMARVTAANAAVGLRVVRGADWEWGSQDGGTGQPGTPPRAAARVSDGTVGG